MKHLYHASPHKDLKQLLPQRTLSQDTYIGDFVFATANETLAAMYLATKGVQTLMDAEANNPFVVIGANKASFVAHDVGGAIYTLPPDTFVKSPQEGLEAYELVSRSVVAPISKRVFATSIEAMQEFRITMYFVSPGFFQIERNRPQLLAALKSLPSNQKL